MEMPQHDNQEPREPNSTRSSQNASKKRNILIRLSIPSLVVLLGAAVLGVIIFRVVSGMSHVNTIEKPISDVLNLADHHKLTSVTINGNDVVAIDIKGQHYHASKEDGQPVTEIFRRDGVTVNIDNGQQGQWTQVLVDVVFLALVGGVLFFFFKRGGMGGQASAFGRSKARRFQESHPSILFQDVAGVEEAKMELEEIVEFLKFPARFVSMGARIPKGVLLVGAPGTGKTLISRAVAGEANVAFYSISGSEFVEMFVGVGAARVRDLFKEAKEHAPCIVFIDEIDAVGRQRNNSGTGGNDEREQTLNQLLVEMDGFDTNTNVIVIAATNRPDVLDPALLRPGRFDRQVMLDRPDIRGRVAILQVHAKNKPLEKSVKLETLAKRTPGFSGADLANLLNEAAILGARRNKRSIGMSELEEAIDRVVAGPARKSRIISEREKAITAYHEVGHALVARMLPNTDPVHKVSIVARGQAGGFTMLLPTEDRYLWSKAQFEDMLAYALGGHVAELLIFGDVTTGASNDIERVTKIARSMVTEYGMSSRIGPLALGHKDELVFLGRDFGEQRNYSEQTAREIDEEIRHIIQDAFDKAHNVLLQNKTRLIMISERLIKEETLEGPLFESLFNQPIDSEQYDSPSILAGMPFLKPSSNGEQPLLPEPGVPYPLPPQLQPPYNYGDAAS